MHGQMGVGRAVLAAILSLLSPLGVLADERDFCTSPVVTYASVIERVAPAIVSINLRSPVGLDPSRASRAKGEREEIGAFGSGVIIDSSGLIATTSHGLERNWPITVVLNDQREFDAEIVLTDRRTDLAILRIKGSQDFATVQLGNSDEVRVGDLVLAIGNPYAVGQTVTHGLVSAVGRTQLQINNYEYYIQTDAAINPGSSGGALLDARGRLIGINMAIVSQTRGWQGIGFAVPVNMVAFVADAARRGTDVIRRAWLGAKLVPLDPGSVARLKLNSATGALVRSVVANSPAEQAGLQVNDVISSIDGRLVENPNAFDYRFAMRNVPGKVQLGIVRDGTEQALEMNLVPAPETVPRESTRIETFAPLRGAIVVNLSPAVAEELGLDADVEGVAVTDVEKDTPAQRFGLQRGDILLKANGAKINRARDVERLLRNTRVATLEFDRGGDLFLARITR